MLISNKSRLTTGLSLMTVLCLANSMHAGWQSWIIDPIKNSSTKTKIIAALGATATAGILYKIYRHYYPTDQTVRQDIMYRMNNAGRFTAYIPTHSGIDKNTLDTIAHAIVKNRIYYDCQALSYAIKQSICDLKKDQALMYLRISQSETSRKTIASLYNDVCAFIQFLENGLTILTTHNAYINMRIDQLLSFKYQSIRPINNDIQALIAVIRQQHIDESFPLCSYAKDLNTFIIRIEKNLENVCLEIFSEPYHVFYAQQHSIMALILQDLKTALNTILSSNEYAQEKAQKNAYELEQSRLVAEKERIAQEQQRIEIERSKMRHEYWHNWEKERVAQERLRIEKERLKIEKQRAAHEYDA
jgi:hypothetical protein